MNWGKIAKYAVALLAVQFLLGFVDSFFSPEEVSDSTRAAAASLIVGSLVSFFACTALFAHLSAHQRFRPFAHACLALLLEIAAATLFWQAVAAWLGSIPPNLILLEWVVLVCALMAGTAIGSKLGHRLGAPAGA